MNILKYVNIKKIIGCDVTILNTSKRKCISVGNKKFRWLAPRKLNHIPKTLIFPPSTLMYLSTGKKRFPVRMITFPIFDIILIYAYNYLVMHALLYCSFVFIYLTL